MIIIKAPILRVLSLNFNLCLGAATLRRQEPLDLLSRARAMNLEVLEFGSGSAFCSGSYPRAPQIKSVPTLRFKVRKWYLLWLFGAPGL